MMTHRWWSPLVAMVLAGASTAQMTPAEAISKVGFDPVLGTDVPLDLHFRDSDGSDVTLQDCMAGRPALLQLVYFKCPMLCTESLNGLARSLRVVTQQAGRDFAVLVVSIAPEEGPELAQKKRQSYRERFGDHVGGDGWYFLTGDADSIRELTTAVGFCYARDPATGDYAHAAGLAILSAKGKMTHALYGVDPAPRDIELALTETSDGSLGTLGQKFLLLCLCYDPIEGRYGFAVMSVLRAGGLLVIVVFGIALFRTLRRDRAAKA